MTRRPCTMTVPDTAPFAPTADGQPFAGRPLVTTRRGTRHRRTRFGPLCSGRVGTEEHRRAAEILEPAETLQRNLREHRALPLLIPVKGFSERRSKIAWTHAVHTDAASGPLGGKRPSQAGEAGFRCPVRSRARNAHFGGQGADVHDAAAGRHAPS